MWKPDYRSSILLFFSLVVGGVGMLFLADCVICLYFLGFIKIGTYILFFSNNLSSSSDSRFRSAIINFFITLSIYYVIHCNILCILRALYLC